MTMPFGKYQGIPIQDVPTGYLDWLTTIDLRPWLRKAVQAELERHEFDQRPDLGGRIHRQELSAPAIAEFYRRIGI